MSDKYEMNTGAVEEQSGVHEIPKSESLYEDAEITVEEEQELSQQDLSDGSHSDDSSSETEPPAKPRPEKRFQEISGMDSSGRTKCEIFLRHYLMYSDGTTKEVEEVHIRKPIVYIFAAGGYVNVFLDFFRRTDDDLRLAWSVVQNYMNPANSAFFLPEEVEQGYYITEDGRQELVYYPFLELAISPLGHEQEYMIHGYRPLLYANVSPAPDKDLTVLQLVFKDNLFIVDEEVGEIDRYSVQQEALNEAQMEMAGELPDVFAFLDDE